MSLVTMFPESLCLQTQTIMNTADLRI